MKVHFHVGAWAGDGFRLGEPAPGARARLLERGSLVGAWGSKTDEDLRTGILPIDAFFDGVCRGQRRARRARRRVAAREPGHGDAAV